MTKEEWLGECWRAMTDRAEIDSRLSWTFQEGHLVEPYFPGFKVTKRGEVSYRLSSGSQFFSVIGDLTEPLARLRATVERSGLSVRFVARPRRASWAALFGRKEIIIPQHMEPMLVESFYCFAHELSHFALHRTRSRDRMVVEMEAGLLGYFIAGQVAEVQPLYITLYQELPPDFEPPDHGWKPSPPRTKKVLLASRERLLRGAELIEELFRQG